MAFRLLTTLPLLQLLAFVGDVESTPTFRGEVKRSVKELRNSYDYVVIGGGTSGLVVANRLSEDRSSKLDARVCICIPKTFN